MMFRNLRETNWKKHNYCYLTDIACFLFQIWEYKQAIQYLSFNKYWMDWLRFHHDVLTYVVWRKLDKNLSIDKNLSTDSCNIRKSIELRLQHWNIKYVLHSVNIDNIGKKLTSLVLSNSLTALLKYCCMIRRFFLFCIFYEISFFLSCICENAIFEKLDYTSVEKQVEYWGLLR